VSTVRPWQERRVGNRQMAGPHFDFTARELQLPLPWRAAR
jgi:hypothetical protein